MKLQYAASPEQIAKAKDHAENLGELNNSIRSGQGNFIGYLGEIVVGECFGWTHDSQFDYDLITTAGKKLDVKTKERTVSCLDSYFATVADYNTEQKCDGYVFTSVYQNKAKDYIVEIMGWLPKDEFYSHATFYEKDAVDPNSDDGWTFKAACYNLRYGQLRNIPARPVPIGLRYCSLCDFAHYELDVYKKWVKEYGTPYFEGKNNLTSRQIERYSMIMENHTVNERVNTQGDIYGKIGSKKRRKRGAMSKKDLKSIAEEEKLERWKKSSNA